MFEESHKLFATWNPDLKKNIDFEKKFRKVDFEEKKSVFDFSIASYKVFFALGAIQIQRDTFLPNSSPLLPPCDIWWHCFVPRLPRCVT